MTLQESSHSVATRSEMEEFIKHVPRFPHIAVDTEGDFALDPPLFLGFSLAFMSFGMYFPVAHLDDRFNIPDSLVKESFCAVAESPLRVYQHAGHDLMVQEDIGFSMWDKPFVCTMIAAHMVDENVHSKDLDTLHKIYTGGIGKIRSPEMQQIIDGLGWRYIPPPLMAIYAKQDAIAASELYLALEPLYIEQFGEFYRAD